MLAARGEAAVLLRHREAEASHGGQALDDLLVDVGVGAMDVLCTRGDLLGGEAPEAVLHELEVGMEVRRPGRLGERSDQGRVSSCREEAGDLLMPAGLGAPVCFSAGRTGDEVGHDVGHEYRSEAGLGGSVSSVAQGGSSRVGAGGGVGEVVGEHLVLIEALAAVAQQGQLPDGVAHDRRSQLVGATGSGKVGLASGIGVGHRHGDRVVGSDAGARLCMSAPAGGLGHAAGG